MPRTKKPRAGRSYEHSELLLDADSSREDTSVVSGLEGGIERRSDILATTRSQNREPRPAFL